MLEVGAATGSRCCASGGLGSDGRARRLCSITPEIPISGAVVLEGVPPGSAAKLTLPEGASASVVVVSPVKLGSLGGAEADADYERVTAQVAEQRAREMAACDSEISKRESDLEEAAARYHVGRIERERVATATFVNEMKRRRERLDESDREKISPSGYKIQSASEYERMRRSEAQSAPGGASEPSRQR